MSRMATTSARRNRAVWDRPATDTHLLLWLQPIPVFLGNPLDPLRKSIVASAPSRPPFPQRHRAADARVPSPRMSNPRLIPPASLPHDRGCPRFIADDFLLRLPWRRSGCLRLSVADDFPLRPTQWRKADACGYASRMISRSALLGVEADACANPQMISRTPFRAAEGALANLILILSPFRHSGLRAGIHPFNSSLSSSRDDRPVALGVGAPNGAPTPLSPYTKGPA